MTASALIFHININFPPSIESEIKQKQGEGHFSETWNDRDLPFIEFIRFLSVQFLKEVLLSVTREKITIFDTFIVKKPRW